MMTGQYDLFGGEPPAQRHSDTSQEAAAQIKHRIGPLHLQVIAFLQGCAGATDEEMQQGIPMGANTQRPRRRELQLMGRVIDSGFRRPTRARLPAVIWMLKPKQGSTPND